MNVRFTPEARLSVREKRAWWEQHRDKAPHLFVEELSRTRTIMRFKLPAALLAQLQQRREQQRTQRGSRDVVRAHSQPSSVVGGLRQLFDGEQRDVSHVAAGLVNDMGALQDEVEREHDAFLLDPGMGPMSYLASDGRILLDFRSFDGDPLREASDDEAIATLVVGARKTGLSALLDLVPVMPEGGVVCGDCEGTRWRTRQDINRVDVHMLCLTCHGRGWRSG